MGKIDRVTAIINSVKAQGDTPTKVKMSRTFAAALKVETMPRINEYFIDGRMTIEGLPWEIDNGVRGFKIVTAE